MIKTALHFRKLCLLIWLVAAIVPCRAVAQMPDSLSQEVNGMAAVLNTIDAALKRDGLTDNELQDRRLEALQIGVAAQSIVAHLQAAISELTERRDALKPAPVEEGEEAVIESPQIVAQREEIEAALGTVEEISKRAAAAAARANQLAAHAAELERDRFARQIFKRNRTLFNPELWQEASAELPQSFLGIRHVFGDATNRAFERGIIGPLPLLLFLFSISLVAIPQLRYSMVNLIARRAGHDEPTELSKAVVACLVVLFIMLAPMIGFMLARWVASLLDLASPSLQTVMVQAGIGILVMSSCIGFARGILAPNRPDWRLAAAGEADAFAMSKHVRSAAAIIALGLFLAGIAEAASIPQSIVVLVGSFIILVFAWTLHLVLKPYRRILNGDAVMQYRYQGVLRIIAMAGMLAVFIIVGATLFGYVPLAWFLSKQVILFCIIFAGFALISNLLDAAAAVVLDPESRAIGFAAQVTGLSRGRFAQFGIVSFGLVKLILACVALIAVAAPWGFKSVGIIEQAQSLLAGFQIGELYISPITIGMGFVLFLVGLFLTRGFRSWLNDRLLPTTSIDPGLKNSVSTAVGYLGFILAAVIASAFIGLDLSQLGLVAGALTVGIGFGLQSIVGNFVSGLILLAERPIKAGDWIVVAGEEGTVKKINVRATELETFDRASVVIPNADLITGTVRNWVLGGALGRISLPIGVAYDSDPDEVRNILVTCAREHELVLEFPEPAVYFTDFGDSALLFRLDAYLADIGKGFSVRSDLRFDLHRRFREAGIEIPFPQRDLNIRSTDELNSLIDRAKQIEG